ncbi:hypothetical protein ABZ319_38605 [Nocardia sp. NPDC005978]|uniref:hypothetical protein n=1 Tax=Nocardia sp. NPDC005978 TaxID=3156725 RepID=UPI0033B4D54C
MSDLVTRAQLTLLSRTLHVPVERLGHLEKLGARRLHELQENAARVIFDRHAAVFSRLTLLVPIVPLSISIPLVQKVVPPVMAGRAAGALGVEHPRKAVEATTMLEPAYAAQAAPFMDPHAVGQLAEIAPPAPVVAIVNEILRRGDYVTAGPFLAYATPELIRAVEVGVHDDEGLIRSASYAYSGESVSLIVRQLLAGSERRIPRLLGTVVGGSTELRLAALSVFARCDADVAAGIGDALVEVASTDELGSLFATFLDAGAFTETLRFVGHFTADAADSVAGTGVFADPAVFETLTGALAEDAEAGDWRGLLALAERVDAAARRVGGTLSHFAPETLRRLATTLGAAALWPPLMRVLAAAEPDAQSRIGQVWSGLPEDERRELEQRLAEADRAEALTSFAATLRLPR